MDVKLLSEREIYMSTERKNPFKRDQALNDATSGQLGEEPRPEPYPEKDPHMEAARKRSRQI
jgi:hypothetical protein